LQQTKPHRQHLEATLNKQELIYVGIKGSVLALSAETGGIQWNTPIRTGAWGGGGFVHLVVDGDAVLATTLGTVSCLDRQTGKIRWHNELKGHGLGIASLATARGQSTAHSTAQSSLDEPQAALTAAVIIPAMTT